MLGWVSRLLARSGSGGGVELALTGSDPRVRAPIAASANMLHAALPGGQPPPLAATEDARLLLRADGEEGQEDDEPWPAARRRAYFRRPDRRRLHAFSPHHVYTFHTWDKSLGYADCRLHTGLGGGVDLAPYLGGLPLQLLLEDADSGAVAMHLDVATGRQAGAGAGAAAGVGAGGKRVGAV
ncbi:hypothetical protein GPECTOR_841g78 [Gonium pectorale]|uniref:Domain of unknown function at the cortex 1 domain-containing protein n=1 Tax=Gonium pectorale TaxID=33097 RepID=A0A150FTY6_GONPE|nr:hypothetical protein GPECTOR_841g78 [Gonium pectorale]|eukprot:KXZ41077.1 hypothetical protein GPECTOR_841g78 [Gonium pectorale]